MSVRRHVFTDKIHVKVLQSTRRNLHLKIKTLTGKSTVELIKTMRMKRACELMKETALSVADIAEQTGFQTPGYFIKVFKNHFG